MTPAQIKAIRLSLGESAGTFGVRFLRSGRTVEDWEQGRRNPDALAEKMLQEFENSLKSLKNKAKKNSKKSRKIPG